MSHFSTLLVIAITATFSISEGRISNSVREAKGQTQLEYVQIDPPVPRDGYIQPIDPQFPDRIEQFKPDPVFVRDDIFRHFSGALDDDKKGALRKLGFTGKFKRDEDDNLISETYTRKHPKETVVVNRDPVTGAITTINYKTDIGKNKISDVWNLTDPNNITYTACSSNSAQKKYSCSTVNQTACLDKNVDKQEWASYDSQVSVYHHAAVKSQGTLHKVSPRAVGGGAAAFSRNVMPRQSELDQFCQRYARAPQPRSPVCNNTCRNGDICPMVCYDQTFADSRTPASEKPLNKDFVPLSSVGGAN